MKYLLALGITLVSWSAGWAQCDCVAKYDSCLCYDCDCGLTYDQAYDAAIAAHKPLIVYVRQPARPVPGCVVCRRDRYPGQPVAGVVIGLPDGRGGLDEVAHRDSYPEAAWIARRVGELQADRKRQAAGWRVSGGGWRETPVFASPFTLHASPATRCAGGG